MFLRIAVGILVANREKAQVFIGSDQRDREPRTQVAMALEGLPFFFSFRVRDQDALLVFQHAL